MTDADREQILATAPAHGKRGTVPLGAIDPFAPSGSLGRRRRGLRSSGPAVAPVAVRRQATDGRAGSGGSEAYFVEEVREGAAGSTDDSGRAGGAEPLGGGCR